MVKTNAIRILEVAGVQFSVHEYDVSDSKIDGVSVAAKCERSPDMVFKTLVTNGKTTGLNVFVIPVEFELDLKKAAVAAFSYLCQSASAKVFYSLRPSLTPRKIHYMSIVYHKHGEITSQKFEFAKIFLFCILKSSLVCDIMRFISCCSER
jgi:hypothetical protein